MTQQPKRFRSRLGLALSCAAVAVGCQGVPGRLGMRSQRTSIPPLSTTSSPVVHAGGPYSGGAPAQLSPGTFVPPLPPDASAVTTAAATVPAPAAGASSSHPNPASTPAAPGSRPLPPAADSCLPNETQWRQQVEDQASSLSQRLEHLESELKTTRASLQAVNQTLQESQGMIQQLNQEIARWKGEVRRLEEDMRSQQLADLKSLDELTASLHQVILRQNAVPRSQEEH